MSYVLPILNEFGSLEMFCLAVAAGEIKGWSSVEKFGENPAINVDYEYIWDLTGTDYVPPTTARIHNVASTSANDAGTVKSSGTVTGGSLTTLADSSADFLTDSVAVGDLVLNDSSVVMGEIVGVAETILTVEKWIFPSNLLAAAKPEVGDSYRVASKTSTGAAVFWIVGQDATRTQKTEFVVMNGQTNVATSLSYLRQYRARVFLAGSGNGAVGTITSTAQTDGTVSLQVVNGNNQTLMAIYSIPSDKQGYLVSWWASLSRRQAAASVVRFRIGDLDEIGYIQQTRALNSIGKSDFKYNFKIPLSLAPETDIWVEADSSAEVGVGAGFTILLKSL